MGAVSVGAQFINDDDMYVAASALAAQVSPEDLESGNAYPPLNDIRKVSLHIAAAVAENMVKTNRAARKPADGESYVENAAKFVYTPSYDF